MKTTMLIRVLVCLTLVELAEPARAGTCRLTMVIDRSGSITTLRNDGSGRTRCCVASNGALATLNAYFLGDFYDVKTLDRVRSTNDDYDTHCPNVNNRYVSI